MKKFIMAFAILLLSISSFAQHKKKHQEKGRVVHKTNIKPTHQNAKKKSAKKVVKKDPDFRNEDEPKLHLKNEPQNSITAIVSDDKVQAIRELNRAVDEDTSTRDEGRPQVVETEELAQFAGSEDWVKIASYFSVWDEKSVNPYGIDPKDFEENIPIQLYDISQGRYWSAPMNQGRITSTFKWRWGRMHKGTDLSLHTGDPVYAAFDGIVRVASYDGGGFGRFIVVRHYNGLETVYGHLSRINLESGTIVKAGDEIGLGGSTGHSTGPHLHFETRYEGNPFDSENIFTYSPEQINIISQEFLLTPRIYDYLRGGRPAYVKKPANIPLEVIDEEDELPTSIIKTSWIRVRQHDTLSEIASKFNLTVAELAKLNKIKPSTRLRVGYRLRVK